MRTLSWLLLGVSLGIAAAILLMPDTEKPTQKEDEWDIVDEASAESFPASDSPAY